MDYAVIRSSSAGFRRCGVAHPAEDVVHPANAFSEQEWEVLAKEPRLLVRGARPDEVAAFEAGGSGDDIPAAITGLTEAQLSQLDAVIRALPFADFTGTGKPKVGVVQDALKEAKADFTVSGKDVAAAFDRMVAAGFTVPTAPGA